MMAITDWPEDERPRERLLAQGAAALSDAELLALFLRVRWKRARAADLARMLCGPFAASLAAGLLAAGWAGAWTAWKPWVALSLILAAWIALTALLHVVQRVRATRTAPWAQPAAFLGMHLAHLGIAVFVVGVALVNGYQVERDVRLAPGERVALAGYEFRFQGVRQAHGANYQALVGAVDLIRDGRVLRQLAPEKRIYPSSGMPMTEAAIDSGFLRDVYVSLGEPVEREHVDGDWVLRLHYKPFVGWIWGGCALMALGGLLAMSDRRYRIGRPGQSNVGAPPRRARETVR